MHDKACRHIVGTTNSTKKFDCWDWRSKSLIQLAIVDDKDCPFEFQNYFGEAEVIRGQSEDSCSSQVITVALAIMLIIKLEMASTLKGHPPCCHHFIEHEPEPWLQMLHGVYKIWREHRRQTCRVSTMHPHWSSKSNIMRAGFVCKTEEPIPQK